MAGCPSNCKTKGTSYLPSWKWPLSRLEQPGQEYPATSALVGLASDSAPKLRSNSDSLPYHRLIQPHRTSATAQAPCKLCQSSPWSAGRLGPTPYFRGTLPEYFRIFPNDFWTGTSRMIARDACKAPRARGCPRYWQQQQTWGSLLSTVSACGLRWRSKWRSGEADGSFRPSIVHRFDLFLPIAMPDALAPPSTDTDIVAFLLQAGSTSIPPAQQQGHC